MDLRRANTGDPVSPSWGMRRDPTKKAWNQSQSYCDLETDEIWGKQSSRGDSPAQRRVWLSTHMLLQWAVLCLRCFWVTLSLRNQRSARTVLEHSPTLGTT